MRQYSEYIYYISTFYIKKNIFNYFYDRINPFMYIKIIENNLDIYYKNIIKLLYNKKN